MRYQLMIEPEDIEVVHHLLGELKAHPFVMARKERNVATPAPVLSRDDFWQVQIMCLVTTQNKSGAGSAVDNFLSSQPFPLSLEKCRAAQDINGLIENTFSKLRIRRWIVSSGFAQQNFSALKQGGWDILEKWQERLLVQRNNTPSPSHYTLERKAAQDVQKLFRGLGPKQSRNFWQDLGLTRYEIPLDSRIMRWLNKYIEFYTPSSGLADERFYCQIMDALRELALKARVLPCMLDAAIFASFEK